MRPEHKEKKAWVCNGSACMCAGNQDKLKEKLADKLGKDKVGEMFCLGHCYENNAFHYDGYNYSGKDIDQIDEIIKGKKINEKNINSISHATTSILMGVGAPTSLAIDLAKRSDMTLIGFVKSDSFNIYCGENRILKTN